MRTGNLLEQLLRFPCGMGGRWTDWGLRESQQTFGEPFPRGNAGPISPSRESLSVSYGSEAESRGPGDGSYLRKRGLLPGIEEQAFSVQDLHLLEVPEQADRLR